MDPRSDVRKRFVASQKVVKLAAQDVPEDGLTVTNKKLDVEKEIENTETSTAIDAKNEVYSHKLDGTLICNLCGKTYKLLGSLKKHLTSNHELTDIVHFICKKCNISFDTKKKLSRHENAKTSCT